jgi:TatA/E family protein of Tat protein translocase
MGIENPVHLLFIAAVALIVLGPKRLPEVAKALGHGIREFREAVSNPDVAHAPRQSSVQQQPHEPPPVVPPETAVQPPSYEPPPIVRPEVAAQPPPSVQSH